MPHPPRGRRPASFVPRLEALEDRQLLAACTVTVVNPGTVLVRGSNGPDRVQIMDDGTANVNNVVLVCNRRTVLPGVAVTRVEVRTRGGDDSVRYFLNGTLGRNVARTVVVDLGTGNDVFAARLNAGLTIGANLAFEVMGEGNDNLSLNANNDIPIPTGSALSARLSGGGGFNVIRSNYVGQLSGLFTLLLTGGPRRDLISSQLTANQGSVGMASIQELGGFGDDRLILIDRKASLLDRVAITAVIDGGPGFNTAIASTDVSINHVRKKIFV